MGKIHELSAVLADQIAAGEVVERPASVVKELVENAVDANSTQIDITVEEAGLKRITVVDDGDGISDDDAERAFLRHATSKIHERKDLFRVASLGFRGEALASIASVAEVTMTTSTGGPGTLIEVTGGQITTHQPAEARPGTSVTVRNLFYNVPARLKYLKSPMTELAKISDIVNRLALSYPSISFSLVHDGKELLRTAGRGDLQQVIAGIYGVQSARKMVAFTGEDADFSISGYTSLPELTRASRQYISILLNGRYIRNNQLNQAIIKGYGSKLMVGRYPVTVLNIQMDRLLVDVNVHPTKQTVRLSKEPELMQLIRSVIFDRLAQETLIPDALTDLAPGEATQVTTDQLTMQLNDASSSYSLATSDRREAVSQPPVTSQRATDQLSAETTTPVANSEVVPIMIRHQTELTTAAVQDFDRRYQGESEEAPFDLLAPSTETTVQPATESSAVAEHDRFPQLMYIGQMHGTYLLAEAPDGLYVVDQHAAQERVNYEYYRQAIGQVSDDQQNLLVPIVLDYPTVDVLTIKEHLDILTSVGVQLESFGPNSFIVHAHPTWFKAGQEEATLREMIDWVIKDGQLTVAAFREKTAIMMSCKRAIKANHHLDQDQAKALLKKLREAENPFNCPHGRPVLVHFTNQDMEKMFKRIQDPHQSYGEDLED